MSAERKSIVRTAFSEEHAAAIDGRIPFRKGPEFACATTRLAP